MPYRISMLPRFFLPVAVLASLAVAPVALAYKDAVSAGYEFKFDESKVEKWKELEVPLPAFPDDRNLIPVRMPANYTLKIYLDEKSISLAQDEIVRFTLVVETSSGTRNVFYEGLRCDTREYKTYAVGTLDKTFEPIKKPKWERVPYYEMNAFRYQLMRFYVCHPEALSAPPAARELIHRLKSSMNE